MTDTSGNFTPTGVFASDPSSGSTSNFWRYGRGQEEGPPPGGPLLSATSVVQFRRARDAA